MFREVFIDMVYRLVSNNWYSVLLNGQANGSQTMWSLSPILLILATEVLGRALDALFDNPKFTGSKWGHNINYFLYAENTIIFSSSHYGAIQLIMNILEEYEATSG